MITEMLKKRGTTLDEFRLSIAKDGSTYELYKDEVRDHLIRNRLANREIRSKITVSEQEIGEYYAQHRDEYEGREQVKLKQILIPCPANEQASKRSEAMAEAQFVLARLKAGDNFEALAAQYAPNFAGGDVGFIEKGAMLPTVEDAAFKLKIGETSDIVESPVGFHIIQVLDKRGAGIKSMQSVRTEIVEEISKVKTDKKFDEWITELRKKSHIEIRL